MMEKRYDNQKKFKTVVESLSSIFIYIKSY